MRIKGYDIPIEGRTCIMGVLNVTPDSFSDGGIHMDRAKAVATAISMARNGADLIDVGGESSRPGAVRVSEEEEMDRVVPVIKAISSRLDVAVSVDTCKSRVAAEALDAGAVIVNDITGLSGDQYMAEVVASRNGGMVLMHMRGNPRNMQDAPEYGNVVEDVMLSLAGSIDRAEKAGISPRKIFVDPGIGFGKTLEHNLIILRELGRFKSLDRPLLIGTSRKSFIGALTGKDVDERIFGTAGSVAAAIMKGADVIRVHDVEQMRDVALVVDAIKRERT